MWRRIKRDRFESALVRGSLIALIEDDEDIRGMVRHLVRRELKDYMQELSEQAGIAFVSPAGFLRGLHVLMGRTTAADLRLGEDEVYDPDRDPPFTVLEDHEPFPGEGQRG